MAAAAAAAAAAQVGLNEDGFGANFSQGLVVVVAVAIGPRVVGHDRLEADVAFGKPGQSSPEEAADSHRRYRAARCKPGASSHLSASAGIRIRSRALRSPLRGRPWRP